MPSLSSRHARHLRLALAAPLALALAACGGDAEGDAEGTLTGDPIAPIEAPEGTSWLDQVQVTPEDGYLIGNPDAPLKLVEYASHTCGACAQFAQTGMPILRDEYVAKGYVSLELRNLVRDPVDLVIAMLARCGEKESFHALADQGWENFSTIMQPVQQNGEAIQQAVNLPEDQRYIAIAQEAGLFDFFAARGISADQARSCLADPAKARAIAQNTAEQSDELGVTGTPTFFLNGQKLEVNQWPGLEPILQQAGARDAGA